MAGIIARLALVTPNDSDRRTAASRPAPGHGAGLAIFTEAIDSGGTERVVQTLADRFPAAAIVANHFAGLLDPGPDAPPWTARARLVPSGRRKRHYLGPLYGRRLAAAPVASAHVVLTLSSGGWALAAPVPRGGRLVCYITGPPPALYGEARLYLQAEAPALRPLLAAGLPMLRGYYRRLMRRPDRLVAVSRSSADAIARVYGHTAEIVHPPVGTEFFTPAAVPRRHFLAVARLVPQKRLNVLVEAFRSLDETLLIAGRGPWLDRLRTGAPSNVRFTGWVDDLALRDLYRSSLALVCPSVEDFGIVMAEAQACGIPVIAPRAGGACEIVDGPSTGILLETVDVRSVTSAVRAAAACPFDALACRASAERFAEKRFLEQIERIVADELAAAGTSWPLPD